MVARHKQDLQEITADHNSKLDKALADIREEYEDLLAIERKKNSAKMAQLEKILAERSIKLSGSKEQITELQSQLQQINRKIETSQAQWESKVRHVDFFDTRLGVSPFERATRFLFSESRNVISLLTHLWPFFLQHVICDL